MVIGLGHYLTVAAMLFTLGVFGIFINRKNVIVILMSVELILLAVNINLVAFSSFGGDLVGQVFALLILTVAAAEAAIGLAILVVYLPQPRHHRGRGHQHDEGLRPVLYQAIVFLPLVGFLIAGLFGRMIGARASEVVTTALLVVAALLSWIAFFRSASARRHARAGRALDGVGRPQGRLGIPDRHAHGRDADGGEHSLGARPPLFRSATCTRIPIGRASSPICRFSPSPC